MSDPMDQYAFGGQTQGGQAGVASFALGAAELHLDEFVIVQGTFGFGDDRGSDPGRANEQHRVQRVTQTS